jgi:hypothetical protein
MKLDFFSISSPMDIFYLSNLVLILLIVIIFFKWFLKLGFFFTISSFNFFPIKYNLLFSYCYFFTLKIFKIIFFL